MALNPKVKLQANIAFPADVNGRTGITVTKQGGKYFLDLDFSKIAVSAALPPADIPNTYVLTYNKLTGSFVMVPAASLIN